jgi:hypothetical protein
MVADHEHPDPEERDVHESGDESDDDENEEIPQVDVDVTKLTPLSPEVISKQVRPHPIKCSEDSNDEVL